MCGRYSLGIPLNKINFDLPFQPRGDVNRLCEDIDVSYNIAPNNCEPILVGCDSTQAHTDERERTIEIVVMKWGIDLSNSYKKLINCRDDSLIAGSTLWKSLRNHNRCVIIAQGYYEWKVLSTYKNTNKKQPYYIKNKKNQLIYLAGVYKWDKTIEKNTFVIITRKAVNDIQFIHDRMPLILDPINETEDFLNWLSKDLSWEDDKIHKLVSKWKVYSLNQLEWYPVDSKVNKVGTNSAEFILPLKTTCVPAKRDPEEPLSKQTTLDFFKKSK